MGALALAFLPGHCQCMELFSLGNGAPLAVESDARLERETFIFAFDTGARVLDARDAGTLPLLKELYDRRFRARVDEELELGMEWGLAYDGRGVDVWLKAPAPTLQEAAGLIWEAISRELPVEADLGKAKEQSGYTATGALSQPKFGLNFFARRDLFAGNPEFVGPESGPKAQRALDLSRIEAARKKLFDPARLSYAAVGPMSPASLKAWLEVFASRFQGKPIYQAALAQPKDPMAYLPAGVRVRIWPQPRLKECLVTWVSPQPALSGPSQILHASVAMQIFDGGMDGFMNRELRTKRGLTYYAAGSQDQVSWTLYSQCDEARLGEMLALWPALLQKFQAQAFDEASIHDSVSAVRARLSRMLAMPWDALFLGLYDWRWQGRRDLAPAQLELAVDPGKVADFARSLTFSQGCLYIAGNEEAIRKALSKAGWVGKDIGILDTDGL